MKIVFFGEGVIAAGAAKRLQKEFGLAHVFTTEEAVERSRSKAKNPLTAFANEAGVPLVVVKKITDEVVGLVRDLQPDIIVVVSFGLFLPSSLLRASRLPPINLHPSALPKYRGAAPIARAIENGDSQIGVCVIEVVKKMDAGDIFASASLPLEGRTSSQMYDAVGDFGGQMLCKVVAQMRDGVAKGVAQGEEDCPLANKIDKTELLLDFAKDASSLVNKIRAFDVFGGCYFVAPDGQRVKIWQAECLADDAPDAPDVVGAIGAVGAVGNAGNVGDIDPQRGLIRCAKGFLRPLILQRENRPKMPARDFWNGFKKA